MNKWNEEIIKITSVLDECGYEVIEIKPQWSEIRDDGNGLGLTGYTLI